MDFPDDADGAVLRGLKDRGADLTKPRLIEFYATVPDREEGERIAALLEEKGFGNSRVEEDDDEDIKFSWYGELTMVPEHGVIVEMQRRINEILVPLGGCCDGWGTFGTDDGTYEGQSLD